MKLIKLSLLTLIFSSLIMASIPAHAYSFCQGGALYTVTEKIVVIAGIETLIQTITVDWGSPYCMQQ